MNTFYTWCLSSQSRLEIPRLGLRDCRVRCCEACSRIDPSPRKVWGNPHSSGVAKPAHVPLLPQGDFVMSSSTWCLGTTCERGSVPSRFSLSPVFPKHRHSKLFLPIAMTRAELYQVHSNIVHVNGRALSRSEEGGRQFTSAISRVYYRSIRALVGLVTLLCCSQFVPASSPDFCSSRSEPPDCDNCS